MRHPRLFLVGFMGAGKSTVGHLVAEAMTWTFVDLDRTIERRSGRTIASIFERDGEAAFRRLESRALAEVCAEERVVVAAGGGIMGAPRNRELLASSGTTVWLAPEFDTMADRLARAPAGVRPLFADLEGARRLYESRLPDYSRAHYRVAVEPDETPAAVAARVVELIGADRCAT